MLDVYTKAVLTVIAVSLSLLAIQGFAPNVGAQSSRLICDGQGIPCTVETGSRPLEIKIVGGRSF